MTRQPNRECDHFDVCHIVHTRKDHKCPSDPENKSCDYDTRSNNPSTAIEAWAIKAPDGSVGIGTISTFKSDAIEKTIPAWVLPEDGPLHWIQMESEGYRCVRVTVQEVKE